MLWKLAILITLAMALCEAESLSFQGKRYTYSLYQPKGENLPALLHGAGGAGRDLLDVWKPFAKAHGIVLIAPDLPKALTFEEIAPVFFRAVVGQVDGQDPQRIYLFGYSMGGYLAYDATMFAPDYFAAVAVYANFISPGYVSILRGTRDLLQSRGFPVHYREFAKQGHDYGR